MIQTAELNPRTALPPGMTRPAWCRGMNEFLPELYIAHELYELRRNTCHAVSSVRCVDSLQHHSPYVAVAQVNQTDLPALRREDSRGDEWDSMFVHSTKYARRVCVSSARTGFLQVNRLVNDPNGYAYGIPALVLARVHMVPVLDIYWMPYGRRENHYLVQQYLRDEDHALWTNPDLIWNRGAWFHRRSCRELGD